MPKITYLENGRASHEHMFLVYVEGKEYKAIKNTPDKTIIEHLPCPTPQFIKIMARNECDAIEYAKGQYHEDLLSSPI